MHNVGAILYGLRWPNPWPHTFGYHEFFDAFTAAAAASHYGAVWFVVLINSAAVGHLSVDVILPRNLQHALACRAC